MATPKYDCPHCGTRNSVQSTKLRRLAYPIAWITAFAVIFGMALTTVMLLMIAPALFVITFCLIGGIHQWVGDGDRCESCGKYVLGEAELRRMGPVRVVTSAGGAEREVPLQSRAA